MIVIYGAAWCGWCKRAKALAEQYQLSFEYRDIDEGDNKTLLKEGIDKDAPGARSIPQIWWNGNYIGGYDKFAQEVENTRSFGQENM